MRFLDKYAAREKELRRLKRESFRLNQARDDAPIVPLEHPYQRGWTKTFVLEERVERRPDAQLFRNMLRVINRRLWCRDRSFTDRQGRELVLRPRVLDLRAWEKLAWPASHQRFFQLGSWRDCEPACWWFAPYRFVWGYRLHLDGWLREETQPFVVTHQRVELPEVRSRLARIEAFMARTRGWERLWRRRPGADWDRIHNPPRRNLRESERTGSALSTASLDT